MSTPLTVAVPYLEAVDLAQSAWQLEQTEREDLLRYIITWFDLSDRLLTELITRRPELVATALLDRAGPPAAIPVDLPGPAESGDSWRAGEPCASCGLYPPAHSRQCKIYRSPLQNLPGPVTDPPDGAGELHHEPRSHDHRP
jgi:hypothetical protein